MYHFFYDESEHSRKINYDTVSASNYYDNFVSVIVGWPEKKEQSVFEKYRSFETKYSQRKDKDRGQFKEQLRDSYGGYDGGNSDKVVKSLMRFSAVPFYGRKFAEKNIAY